MMRAFAQLQQKIKEPVLDFILDLLMRSAKRHAGRTPFNYEELKFLRRALISQNLCCIDGEMVSTFEKEFAYTYGVPYAVASTSGTAAIHVALGALDLNPGDEVITAPITDLGTIIPILYQNAIPVFADIDDTYNMDPHDVEKKITPRTRAIIVVHLFGNPCNMDALADIAKRHRIPLVEDCAQAHLTEYKGRYVGTIGDLGCFSFQQSKHMTTGDGGMTITRNKTYYDRMKLFADKGYARKGWGARAYLFHAPNYRMTELVGAVGLTQLKKVKAVVEKRHELGEYLTHLLSAVDGIGPAPVTEGAKHSYWLYPMQVFGADIDSFAKEMLEEKVWVSAGYIGKPIYLCSESLSAKRTYGESQCPFTCNGATATYEYKEGLCPRAEEALKHLICIPLDESWSKGDVERIAAAVAKKIDKLAAHGVRMSSREGNISVAPMAKNAKGKVRIGIVGCGQIGRWHLDSYKKNSQAKVVAVADTDFARAQAFARGINTRAYSSHSEMIEKEALDGVSVCTVPSTHRDIAVELLKAGINVLCEKPLAISVSQAEEMARTAKETNRLLFTAFKFRFYDEVARAKDLVTTGALGKIVSFRLMFGCHLDMAGTWYAKRELAGGGVIMDNGPHAFDLIRHLFGEIEDVSAETRNPQALEVEDTAKLTVSLQSGAVGVVDLTWSVAVPPQAYLEIYGEDGAALLDLEGISYRFETWSEWKRVPNAVGLKEAFARQIDHFVEAIQGKRPLLLGNGEGLRSQTLIDAAYESAKRGSKIGVAL